MLEEGGGGRVQRQGGSPGTWGPSRRSGDRGFRERTMKGLMAAEGQREAAAGDRGPGTMERIAALPQRRHLVDTC